MFKYFIQKNSNKKGFTLVEMLIALSIISVSIVTLMTSLAGGISDTNFAKNKIIASFLAEEGIEYMRNMRDTYVLYGTSPADGWNDFKSKIVQCANVTGCNFSDSLASFPVGSINMELCNGITCLIYYYKDTGKYIYGPQQSGGTDSGFTRKIFFEIMSNNADEVKVISEVSWSKNGVSHNITFSDNLLNWPGGVVVTSGDGETGGGDTGGDGEDPPPVDPPVVSLVWANQNNINNWISVASNNEGNNLVAAAAGTFISTSTDFGKTWTEQDKASKQDWSSVTSDANGANLVAINKSGKIFTSDNFGLDWTTQPTLDSSGDAALASDSTGKNLVATISGGDIYTSSDFGKSWTAQKVAGNQDWSSVATDTIGENLVATITNGDIYTSTNSGKNWTNTNSPGKDNWTAIASDSKGKNLVAITLSGKVLVSNNYGLDWVVSKSGIDGNGKKISVASDYSGKYLIAGVDGGQIYISTDSGMTWVDQKRSGSWISVASSADGKKLVATERNGDIWTGEYK